MKYLSLPALAAVSLIYLQSCRPHNACVTNGGGVGGSTTMSVTPTHANTSTSQYIDSCMVYVKYATLDQPANNSYDDSQKCVIYPPDTIPMAIFKNLKPGLYYFYASGYHTPLHDYVKSAISHTLCSERSESIFLPTYTYVP